MSKLLATTRGDGNQGQGKMRRDMSSRKCFEPITEKMIRDLTSPEVFKTYLSTTKSSYVNQNENIIWCPNPKGCGRAVVYREGVSCDIRCNCGYEFCFKCKQHLTVPRLVLMPRNGERWRKQLRMRQNIPGML